MKVVYRTIFTMAFMKHSDRDDFQTKVNSEVQKIIDDLHLASRVETGTDITPQNEVGYEWFDKDTREPIWASRAIVGFTDKAENVAFASEISSRLQTKDAEATYWTNPVGNRGAINTDIMPEFETNDKTQIDIRA